jgi:hypothetical protein
MPNSGNRKRDLRISRTILYRLNYKDKLATMLLICGINYISEIRNAFLQCPPLLWCICYMWFYSCDVNVLVLNSSPNQLHLWSNDLSMYKTICGLSKLLLINHVIAWKLLEFPKLLIFLVYVRLGKISREGVFSSFWQLYWMDNLRLCYCLRHTIWPPKKQLSNSIWSHCSVFQLDQFYLVHEEHLPIWNLRHHGKESLSLHL